VVIGRKKNPMSYFTTIFVNSQKQGAKKRITDWKKTTGYAQYLECRGELPE